jgi:transposase
MVYVSKLTPAVIVAVADAIKEGCFASVSAQRAGISNHTYYMWVRRGQREAEERASEPARFAGVPHTDYEQFFEAVEEAKAIARYGAETRIYRTQPLQWLRSGYARADWHEVDTTLELEQRVLALERLLEAQREELARVHNVGAATAPD